MPDASRANRSAGVQPLRRAARASGAPHWIVDPNSDLDVIASRALKCGADGTFRVSVTGQRLTRWGGWTGWALAWSRAWRLRRSIRRGQPGDRPHVRVVEPRELVDIAVREFDDARTCRNQSTELSRVTPSVCSSSQNQTRIRFPDDNASETEVRDLRACDAESTFDPEATRFLPRSCGAAGGNFSGKRDAFPEAVRCRWSPVPAGLMGAEAIFLGGGECGALVRSIDWPRPRLGQRQGWVQTMVGVCLSSRCPFAICWGAEFVMLYTDDLIPDGRRQQASARVWSPRVRGAPRDPRDHRATPRAGCHDRGSGLAGGSDASASPGRDPRGVVFHLHVQPDPRRIRCRWRRALRGYRNDREAARRAPPPAAECARGRRRYEDSCRELPPFATADGAKRHSVCFERRRTLGIFQNR